MNAHERELLHLLANGAKIIPWAPQLRIYQCSNMLVNMETLHKLRDAGFIKELELTTKGRTAISDLPQKCGLYQIKLHYATFGIVVKDDKVVEAPPIGKWMIGKSVINVESWVNHRHGTIAFVSETQELKVEEVPKKAQVKRAVVLDKSK